MALIDGGTFVPNAGNYYIFRNPITIDTLPEHLTDAAAIALAGGDNIGHTDIDSVIEFASEGGEITVLGTLQNPNRRARVAPRSENFTINLQQFTEYALKLYYGDNMESLDGGRFLGVPTAPSATEGSFLAVYNDAQSGTFAIFAPRASFLRGEDPEIDDTEDFASLPLQITPLVVSGNSYAYAVTPLVPSRGEGE